MRKGIALLITLMFVMLITISIGIGLKQVNQASAYVNGEKFLYQSSVILDDVLNILKNSQELQDINSSSELSVFLSESSIIPFEAQGINVVIEMSSARSRFNVNNLVTGNKQNEKRVESLKQYVSNNMVITTYVDVLLDSMSGIKEDMSYNSDIFNKKPYLFRDYITSYKHLRELNEYYTNYYHEDSLKNIDFEKLFYYSNNDSYRVDLSYATVEVWEMMLGCDKQRAIDLSSDIYESEADIDLSEKETEILTKFNTSIFEAYIYVQLRIIQDNQSANIRFEYDIENKKGSNFVYEI
ncbi:hypothetical protein [Sulfurimonas sp.]|uniref:hypothetical protein n=1 Tax=Sulfurimonas sp. TaxID=2022749 RepID=UPI002B46F37E|nr:hypothetical protein [Sulfurimonas sp.]